VGRPWWPPGLRYEAYGDTTAVPNVVVDGRGNDATVLTLSHWPKAPCPPDLRRDLSAESALDYLTHASLHGDATVVTNNHFDQDGLVSVHALTDPAAALDRAPLLVELARAGDFAVTSSRDAARVSMALATYADEARSPVAASLKGPYAEATDLLYRELLPRLTEWLDDPDRCRELWADEDAQLDADQRLLASGRVAIEEVPELDLTVVELPKDADSVGGHRFGGLWSGLVHPLALHEAIDGFTVLVTRGASIELRFRYESWVQYQSASVRPRVDLAPLATELSELEPGPARWTFDGVAALAPTLHVDDGGPSDLDPCDVRRLVEEALRVGAPAFDPYV
jgi:hypothetical protein